LLNGGRWGEVKTQLEDRFHFVVIDTSPLLVSDTLLLAREADGVVMSVMLGVSQVTPVAAAATRLRTIGAKLTGVIVNGVPAEVYRTTARYTDPSAGEQAGGEPASHALPARR
jgi:Mrp family chromosome partitioning ATPase